MTDNVVPIRSNAAEPLSVSADTLPEDLVAVITASDEGFAETIAAIRRCYGFASPKTLDAMAEAHHRLAALAIGLVRTL